MSDLLPVDVIGVLHDRLLMNRRPPDGKLHCSGDLVGSLRHSMLTLVGAPRLENPLTSEIVLQTGTYWHEYLGEALKAKGVPVMMEVKLDPWLPEGWSGTADYIFFDPRREAWVLADLKTQKGEANRFVREGGAKDEHIYQVSAYWHALVAAGFPMIDRFIIMYVPKNGTADKTDLVEPVLCEVKPLDKDTLWALMDERWKLAKQYADVVELGRDSNTTLQYVNDLLAPPQERIQKMWWNAKTAGGVFDVKLTPHWSADYCDFPDELCDCSTQKPEKIGHWIAAPVTEESPLPDVAYVPREGYESIEPQVRPTPREITRRYGS